jgi:hypothetical protein
VVVVVVVVCVRMRVVMTWWGEGGHSI